MLGMLVLLALSGPTPNEPSMHKMIDTLKPPAVQLVATVTTDSASAVFPDVLNLTVNWTAVPHVHQYQVTVAAGIWNPPGKGPVNLSGGTRHLTLHLAQRSDVGHFITSRVTVKVCAVGEDKVVRPESCKVNRWTLRRPSYLR